ncbi:MAG: hydrogenase 3 maturation endopeptidase HyCI [Candidatus Aminicenantes bacterium]|nr:hydrogenase 3 maturation endopeptidase HyCI [Candidatus Aminicenantes bacterium]
MDYHDREDHPLNGDVPNDWRQAVAAALSRATRIAVCGIGNDLRGDDAAGLLCLRQLETNPPENFPRVSGDRPAIFIEGGETPENQTGRMRKFQPDLVLLIDAARGGRRPGEIFIVEKEKFSDEDVSTHRTSLSLLVRYIEESVGALVVFLGIEPVSTEINGPVSDAVRTSVSILADHIRRYL